MLLVLCLGLVAPAEAQRLDAGSPEGAETTAFRDAGLDSFALPVAPFTPQSRPVRELTGRVTWAAHRLEDETATVAGVVADYGERLEAMGFRTVFECRDKACGGFDFRFGIDLLPAPGMLMDVADFAQLSMATADDRRFASILVSRALGAIYVQTVMVAPAEAGAPAIDDVETAATPPETTTVAPAGDSFAERLRADGHVRIDGLAFDTGGARLSPASADALDRLAALLREDETLDVAIVGHSDTVGGYESNLTLSRRRAEAVMAALAERGVPAGRMEARGIAYLAPIASNATEEGRRLNRRVELVMK